MVTPQDYLKRFFKGMQQRSNVLLDKLAKKRNVDGLVKTSGKLTETQVDMIKWILGEDNKPRKGKIDERSLRYLLFKAIKSAKFLEKRKTELVKRATAQGIDPDVAEEISGYIEEIYEQLSRISDYAAQLENIYAEEIDALAAKDKEAYLSKVEEEQNLLAKYSTFYDELAEKANPRINEIAYIIKRYKGTEADYKVTIGFLVLMAVTLGFVPLVFPPKPEEVPLFPTFAVIATALWAAIEGKNILADIQTTLQAYQKEIWTD